MFLSTGSGRERERGEHPTAKMGVVLGEDKGFGRAYLVLNICSTKRYYHGLFGLSRENENKSSIFLNVIQYAGYGLLVACGDSQGFLWVVCKCDRRGRSHLHTTHE